MVVSPFIGLGMAIYCIYRAFKLKNKLDKYAFENTTDGGVLQFKTFEESKKYKRQRNIQSGVLPILALGFFVAGIFLWK